jgi:hypothetical protein
VEKVFFVVILSAAKNLISKTFKCLRDSSSPAAPQNDRKEELLNLGVYYINDSDRRGKMESGWGDWHRFDKEWLG